MNRKIAIDFLRKNYRTPLYHQNFPLLLLWSPKAGCTTFARWFFFQIGLLEKALAYHPSIHVYKGAVHFKQKNYLDSYSSGFTINKKTTYKLIRDPYKRAVSSYFTIANYCYSNGLPNSPMNKDKDRILSMYYPHSSYKGISFKQFLYYLSKVGSDYTIVDGHIAKQYCLEEEYLDPKLIRLENFNQVIKRLEEKYKLLSSPDHVLTSPHSFKTKMTQTEFNSNTILTPEQLIHGPLPNAECLFDEETIQLCNHVYHDDFVKYKYPQKT
ncbi:sulfotransferase family protein [Bacillus sp. BHET2]|uniref:sulfotransferase family 2 domain-containing protein n=1 Tax=Bacillus sp. BHET2 TaxID=2583818 RepID=UPI00110EBC69|nr:sulfotransferase family 2 domain-containing protein [Bacillus sp. BHET2]TMU87704.1 sulfotransferase family protein [Bacillus sp. BHET2]